jgi:hypothetical protein
MREAFCLADSFDRFRDPVTPLSFGAAVRALAASVRPAAESAIYEG